VIISNSNNDFVLDSLKSLKDIEIKVIKDSLLNEHFKNESKAVLKTYNTIGKLLNSIGNKNIIAIDKQTYDYYKKTDLKNFTIIYESNLNTNYEFIVTNTDDNKVFSELLNFYINIINKKEYTIKGYNNLVKSNISTSIINLALKYILYVSLGAVVLFFALFKFMARKKSNKQIKKEDKLKFVDMLTSLKNRNYLNYNMNKWDNNNTYPQAIIIVDLNNVQYINDNFGHKEGDNVIVDAANILINSQLENSDIIRTDGNEFLVYLVGYQKEEILDYIKKLNKEFKGLAHSFGAAVGYSIIKDEITTIDDAINEATLDMRTNKENSQE
jgi:diguanylate cyclase (GGDEF)-like protein